MAHPVADEREPPLHEEDADQRGDQPDEHGGEQRPLHEVVGEQGRSSRPSRRAGLGVAGERRSWVGELVVVVVGVVVVQDLDLPGQEHVARSVEVSRPRSTTTTLVTTSTNASSSWVTTSMVTPCAASRPSTSASTCWFAASTPAVGSSMRRTFGLSGQRPRDQHPSLLAARERADVGRRSVGQPDDVEGARDEAAVGGRRPAEPGLPHEAAGGDDLLRGRPHRAGQGVPLRHVAQPRVVPGPREPLERRTEEVDLAAEPVAQAEQALDDRGLAGAVRPEDRHDLTGVDVEGDVPDHRGVRIPERRRPQRDDGGGGGGRGRSCRAPLPGLEDGEV